jgi:hypothetical protein
MKTISIATLICSLAVAGCGGGGGGGRGGSMTLLATDSPFTLDILTEARVHVVKITLQGGDDEEDEDGNAQDEGDGSGNDDGNGGDNDDNDDNGGHGDDDGNEGGNHGPVTFFQGSLDLNLLDLRNGVSAQLAQGDLPPGSYSLIRLYVDSAEIKLTNGNVYSTNLGNLDLGCAMSTGLKIFVNPPIDVSADSATTLLLDFDLSRTFRPNPPDDPLNATSYQLAAGIRATNRETTGDFRGTVTMDDGMGGHVGVDTATVYVLPPGETDPANAIASTATTSDGSYGLLGLDPGSYDLLAVKGTLKGSALGVAIVARQITTVDLFIQ